MLKMFAGNSHDVITSVGFLTKKNFEIITETTKVTYKLLTEKEIDTIIFLSKKELPVTVDELQEKVWGYQSKLETHTVETHVYRLRKKIFDNFC